MWFHHREISDSGMVSLELFTQLLAIVAQTIKAPRSPVPAVHLDIRVPLCCRLRQTAMAHYTHYSKDTPGKIAFGRLSCMYDYIKTYLVRDLGAY